LDLSIEEEAINFLVPKIEEEVRIPSVSAITI